MGSYWVSSKILSAAPVGLFTDIIYGQFSVKTPTPVHPFLKVEKPLQIWFIFCLQDVLERKKYENGKKNSMRLVR
jgi:hypothetical protein